MSGRMDKGLNVLNVVMQDGQRSQCVEHHNVELVSDAQLTFLVRMPDKGFSICYV